MKSGAPTVGDAWPAGAARWADEAMGTTVLATLHRRRVDDVFAGRVTMPVKISPEAPLVGLLWYDRTGRLYLSPREDDRRRNEAAIAVHGASAAQLTLCLGHSVQVAGTFEPRRGLTVEAMGLEGRGFVEPGGSEVDGFERGQP